MGKLLRSKQICIRQASSYYNCIHKVFIAGISLLIVDMHKDKKIQRSDFKYIFIIGCIGYFISVSAQLLGIKYANASLASLINAMNPIMIMIFASIFLKEKLTIKKSYVSLWL